MAPIVVRKTKPLYTVYPPMVPMPETGPMRIVNPRSPAVVLAICSRSATVVKVVA